MLYPDELKIEVTYSVTIGLVGKEGLEPPNQLYPKIICDETVNLDYPKGRRATTAYFTNLHTSPYN